MSDIQISVILNCHAEKPVWIKRALKSIATQVDAPRFETIVVADKPTQEVHDFLQTVSGVRIEFVEYGDLGESRNHGFRLALGQYCCTLDADDLYGCLWLNQAYEFARALREERKGLGLNPDLFVLHQETMHMFGTDRFLHKCIGDDHPEFDAKDLLQWNCWAASCFAPRETYLKYPYVRAQNGYGYEDFTFHVSTYGDGVSHRVVPGSVYAVRLKGNESSMAFRYVKSNLIIPRMALYDRRDIPNAKKEMIDGEEMSVPKEVHQQLKVMHHEIGELEVGTLNETPMRRYPRQSQWDDQAALRDRIGDVDHMVMVKDLGKGGAEKYALDWAAALKDAGKSVCVLETEPGQSPWKKRADALGLPVVSWTTLKQYGNPKEYTDILRRAFIQCDLKSLFICNSPIGWQLLHVNPQVLAKHVIAASFAQIPLGHGYTSCPPIYLRNIPHNLSILTDNTQHQERLLSFNPDLRVHVVPPRCDYEGPSKLSRIEKGRQRILWAGRGTVEKGPQYLPALAAACEAWADVHVWGDVRPMNGPESLKYRGPFDGFDKIDGSYDCYLNTSLFEGCPNVAMEAAMADLPIVGPEKGALPELATATYEKFDPLTVATAIKGAIERGPINREAIKKRITEWREDFPRHVMRLTD